MFTLERKAMTIRQMNQAQLDQIIADEFGVNADYVGEILKQFERNPTSVDAEWRSYFDELLDDGHTAGEQPKTEHPKTEHPKTEQAISEPVVSSAPTGDGAALEAGPANSPPDNSPPADTTRSQTASRTLQPAYDWGAQTASPAPAPRSQTSAPAVT